LRRPTTVTRVRIPDGTVIPFASRSVLSRAWHSRNPWSTRWSRGRSTSWSWCSKNAARPRLFWFAWARPRPPQRPTSPWSGASNSQAACVPASHYRQLTAVICAAVALAATVGTGSPTAAWTLPSGNSANVYLAPDGQLACYWDAPPPTGPPRTSPTGTPSASPKSSALCSPSSASPSSAFPCRPRRPRDQPPAHHPPLCVTPSRRTV
jgi:hypothetical protein